MKNIFVIPVEDVQYIAKKKIGRKLTIEELKRVKSGVDFGFECWEEVVLTSIEDLQDIVITKRLGEITNE
ncbi:MAG: hypothetical protein OEZ20_07495 [candidate division WOR-3 bacterium]|nr:hypothetical protein [candidate division WOR-3 bacterium]